MIWGTLYNRSRLDTESAARALLELLFDGPESLRPTNYGEAEPVQNPVSSADLSGPIELLTGNERGGSVYLTTDEFDGTFVLSWVDNDVSVWSFFLNDGFFDERKRVDAFLDLVVSLVDNYDIVYGSIGPREDWEEEHWITTTRNDGGERKVGLDREGCLPVLTWLGIIHECVADEFGGIDLGEASVHDRVEVGDHTVLVLRPTPFAAPQSERLQHSREVMNELGADYFFDITAPGKICENVPCVTGIDPAEDHPWLPTPARDGRFAAFRDQRVTREDGREFETPSELAEMLVVYVHSDVSEVLRYDRDALVALDEYLSRVPQQKEYSQAHLFQQFAPALGAFIGEVLVRYYGGEWVVKEPVLHSVVLLDDQSVDVVGVAYNTVFNDRRLLDQLERLIDLDGGQ